MTENLPAYPMERARKCPFDPAPALRQVDRIARVRIWNGETPWLVTDYELQRSVLTDQRFSSDVRKPGYPVSSAAVSVQRDGVPPFVLMDNPDHDARRRMLTGKFMVKRVEAMRPRVQQIVDGFIDRMLARARPVDLVSEFALPVPLSVICELLGVPYADHEFFHRVSTVLASSTATQDDALGAARELGEYLHRLVEAKDAQPGDDVISALVVEQMRTARLSRDEVVTMAMLILSGGHETTANMIALGTAALLEHPDQLADLRATDDPQVVAGAVEELLRYLSIVHSGLRRTAIEDVEVGGKLVRRGEGVILALEAGNRTGRVFPGLPDPDRLDIRHPVRHHQAFGFGVHQCLGQALARMELQVVYGTLYRRIPTLRLATPIEDVAFKHDSIIYGVHSLPVTW
ncbi:cytochrome P450 [Kribbella yunnanensis]|uniref:Cytochrome P450 n=1 Tax=Kribbella yunnanensis TaxID=190194 RepID=A0ABN2IWP1_9ACTN